MSIIFAPAGSPPVSWYGGGVDAFAAAALAIAAGTVPAATSARADNIADHLLCIHRFVLRVTMPSLMVIFAVAYHRLANPEMAYMPVTNWLVLQSVLLHGILLTSGRRLVTWAVFSRSMVVVPSTRAVPSWMTRAAPGGSTVVFRTFPSMDFQA